MIQIRLKENEVSDVLTTVKQGLGQKFLTTDCQQFLRMLNNQLLGWSQENPFITVRGNFPVSWLYEIFGPLKTISSE